MGGSGGMTFVKGVITYWGMDEYGVPVYSIQSDTTPQTYLLKGDYSFYAGRDTNVSGPNRFENGSYYIDVMTISLAA